MAEQCSKLDVKELIKWMVESSRKVGSHGLRDCSDEVVNAVIKGLMKDKENFETICLKNFPLKETLDGNKDDTKEDIVSKAVKGIKDSIKTSADCTCMYLYLCNV